MDFVCWEEDGFSNQITLSLENLGQVDDAPISKNTYKIMS